MKSLLKEPLLYFLLIAMAMFAVFELLSGNSGDSQEKEIVVSKGRIKSLTLGFEKTWQRKPSEDEEQSLLENYIRDEVLYREAKAMGLDRDDRVVRQRMAQKMKVLAENLVAPQAPREVEIKEYFSANVEQYRISALFSFKQVYINPDKHLGRAGEVATKLLKELQNNSIQAEQAGDPLMVSNQFDKVSEREVVRALGDRFLDELQQVNPGTWQGPIGSGFRAPPGLPRQS